MNEIWKPVAGYGDFYEVSNLGRVRSREMQYEQATRWGTTYLHRKRGRVLRPGIASNGYPTVALRRKTRTVHSLVAEAFIGPCPIKQEVRHKDGNRKNPRADNLCYGTRLDNINDAIAAGTYMSPARIAWNKSGNARRGR